MKALLLAAVLVAGLAPGARAVSFTFAYEAVIVASEVPLLTVGSLVPDNVIEVSSSSPNLGQERILAGSWSVAGLLTFDLFGSSISESPDDGWQLETAGTCSVCWVLFGLSSGPPMWVTTHIQLDPGDGDFLPPAPFASGVQTVSFSGDFFFFSVVAELVPLPAPPAPALLLAALPLAAATRARARR